MLNCKNDDPKSNYTGTLRRVQSMRCKCVHLYRIGLDIRNYKNKGLCTNCHFEEEFRLQF